MCRAPLLYQDLVVCCLFGVDLQLAGCALADAVSGGVELILGRKGPAVVPVIGAMCGAIGYLYPVGLRRRCSGHLQMFREDRRQVRHGASPCAQHRDRCVREVGFT